MKYLNKSAIFTAVGLLLTTNFVGAAQEILFAGLVIENTCKMRVEGSVGPSYAMVLDDVLKRELDVAGKTAGHKTFKMELYGCKEATSSDGSNNPYGVKAVIYSNEVEVLNGVGLLKNNSTDPQKATNVYFQLTKTTPGETIDLVQGGNYVLDNYIVTSANTKEYQLGVQYYATGVATTGQVKSQATFAVVNP